MSLRALSLTHAWTLLRGCSLHYEPHLPSCLVGQLPPLISSGSSDTRVGDIPSHPFPSGLFVAFSPSLPYTGQWTHPFCGTIHPSPPSPQIDWAHLEDSSCGWKLNLTLLTGSPGDCLSSVTLYGAGSCNSEVSSLPVPGAEHTPHANLCFPQPSPGPRSWSSGSWPSTI